jgi:hypothetical protein
MQQDDRGRMDAQKQREADMRKLEAAREQLMRMSQQQQQQRAQMNSDEPPKYSMPTSLAMSYSGSMSNTMRLSSSNDRSNNLYSSAMAAPSRDSQRQEPNMWDSHSYRHAPHPSSPSYTDALLRSARDTRRGVRFEEVCVWVYVC